MPFNNATFRGDLNSYVLEAAQASNQLIGLQVAPVAPVSVRAGQYPKITIASSLLLSGIVDARAPGTGVQRVQRKVTQDTYTTQQYALEEAVPDEYKADMSRFFDYEVIAAKACAHNLLLGHEVRVAAETMNASNFTAANSVVAYTQANLATADFARDLQTAIEALNSNGVEPDTLVMSDTLLNYITRTTLFQNFVKPYSAGVSVLSKGIVANAVREAFGLSKLLVGTAARNTSKTSTASLSKVWGTTYIWVGKTAAGLPEAGGALRTFAWTGDGGEFVTESYRDDARISDIIRVKQAVDEKVVDSTAGRLITTQYS